MHRTVLVPCWEGVMAIILLVCVICSCHNQPPPFDGDTFVKEECLFRILGEC